MLYPAEDRMPPVTSPSSPQALCAAHGLSDVAPEGMVAIALSSLGKMPIYGTRIALPQNGTVSWFIHCGEHSDAADFYQPVHTAHMAELLPQVVNYLHLPPGAKFIIDDQGYEDVWMNQ